MKIIIFKILSGIIPRKLLYFSVIKAWAIVTTEKYTNLEPDEVTWSMVCKYLQGE